jgi:hypothetical protein
MQVALIITVAFSMSGCATIMTGPTQKIPISSNPSGATVQVDGQTTFVTPATVTLERKNDHILVFTKEGYNQQTVTLLHVISGAVCGNIILGGLIGWGVDAMTGAQFKLVPTTVHVEMQKASSEGPQQPAVSKEMTIEDKIVQLKKLFDEGAITKEEYEANKKVLLQQITKEKEEQKK